MHTYRMNRVLLSLLCIVCIASFAIALSGKKQTRIIQQDTTRNKTDDPEIPTVRFEGRAGTHEIKRSAHDQPLEESPAVTEITESDSWLERVPALPVELSDAVIKGTVTQSQAQLATEKTAVYSEYSVTIDAVLTTTSNTSLTPGMIVTLIREGGRVQFASGHTQTYRMSGQGFPKLNHQYVFFIKQNTDTKDFLLLTGYQVKNKKILPLDDLPGHAVYKDVSDTEFFSAMPQAINSRKGTRQ
jgi:hypothetical protein